MNATLPRQDRRTTLVPDVTSTHELVAAWPHGPEHALLRLRDERGRTVAGQWFADPRRADRVASETTRISGPGLVGRDGPGVVLQSGGADRRLPVLRTLADADGAVLVAHRPERRAVVRRRDSGGAVRWSKVLRPGRAPDVAAALRWVGTRGVPVPRVEALDADAGTVTTAELPGTPLHALWDSEAVRGRETEVLAAVGRTVARLHRLPAPPTAVRHDPADELAVTRRWLDLAEVHGVLPVPRLALDRLLDQAATLLDAPGMEVGLLHRDLHDKQVVLEGGEVALLDLDLLAVGSPALDLANLAVHVELRAHQQLLDVDAADAAIAGLWEGARPSQAVRRLAAGYALATRLRLVAVYAFRPASTETAVRLLHPLHRL